MAYNLPFFPLKIRGSLLMFMIPKFTQCFSQNVFNPVLSLQTDPPTPASPCSHLLLPPNLTNHPFLPFISFPVQSHLPLKALTMPLISFSAIFHKFVPGPPNPPPLFSLNLNSSVLRCRRDRLHVFSVRSRKLSVENVHASNKSWEL